MSPLPTAAAAVILLLSTFAASPAPAEAPTGGGCQDFGNFVAFLGTELGSEFGATASGVATTGSAVFPNAVVFPEQQQFCP